MTERKKAEYLAQRLEMNEEIDDPSMPREEIDELMQVAEQLSHLSKIQPRKEFVAALRSELLQNHPYACPSPIVTDDDRTDGEIEHISTLKQDSRSRRKEWLRQIYRWRNIVALTACLAFIFVWVIGYLNRPPRVDAQEIVDRMKQSASVVKVNGYQATIAYTGLGEYGKKYQSVSKRWYQSPGMFRQEIQFISPRSFKRTIVVADGRFWSSDSGSTEVWINEMSQSAINQLAGPYLGADGLSSLINSSSNQYEARVVDEEKVANHDSYLLELRPRDKYTFFSMSRVRVWIDKKTFFALRVEIYDGNDQLRSKQETLQITYEPPTDETLFRLTTHKVVSEPFKMGEVINAAFPLKIWFASNQAEYQRGGWVTFQIKLENTASKPIRLGNEPPKLTIDGMKSDRGVWEQTLHGLTGLTLKPGASIQAQVVWRVDAPTGKYLIMLNRLTFSFDGKEQSYDDVGLGGFFVP